MVPAVVSSPAARACASTRNRLCRSDFASVVVVDLERLDFPAQHCMLQLIARALRICTTQR